MNNFDNLVVISIQRSRYWLAIEIKCIRLTLQKRIEPIECWRFSAAFVICRVKFLYHNTFVKDRFGINQKLILIDHRLSVDNPIITIGASSRRPVHDLCTFSTSYCTRPVLVLYISSSPYTSGLRHTGAFWTNDTDLDQLVEQHILGTILGTILGIVSAFWRYRGLSEYDLVRSDQIRSYSRPPPSTSLSHEVIHSTLWCLQHLSNHLLSV